MKYSVPKKELEIEQRLLLKEEGRGQHKLKLLDRPRQI
jgi:hypothetical protein